MRKKRAFIYLKFCIGIFFLDLSRSIGLSASQSFEPLYGDVNSCRLTKKRVSRVFIFLLSHLCLTHIIFTASLNILFLSTPIHATLLVLYIYHDISYVEVHFL